MATTTRQSITAVVLLLMAWYNATLVWAEEVASNGSPAAAALLRLSTKTMGGDQFWADEFVRSGWRIQRQSLSGHYRLLDSHDYRRAIGTFEDCHQRFVALAEKSDLQPRRKTAVVFLHGLLRSRDTMQSLADYVAAQEDVEAVNVTYPSTRGSLDEHAGSLNEVLRNLEGVEQVHFVAHSLGNLVIRRWMKQHCQPNGSCSTASAEDAADPSVGNVVENAQGRASNTEFRIGRFVMLGPPNRGAALANVLQHSGVLSVLAGPSAKQLATDCEVLSTQLCIPSCEFGILAGISELRNPLLSGKSDFIVGVEETRLEGAADFRTLPVHHGDIRSAKEVGPLVVQFLRHGNFGEAETSEGDQSAAITAATGLGK